MTYRFLVLLAVLAAFIVSALPARAVPPVNKSRTGDVAIEGFDTVAYFTEGKPLKGSSEHTFEWQGAVWRFASDENRERFEADPNAYAPQYGGYCAYAVARNKTAGIDPEAWSIVDGKLYLNYSRKIRDRWMKDTAGEIERADANWPKLVDQDER